MGTYANFYNSEDDDRVYDADSFAEWLKPFFTNGVFQGELQVTANNDMTVTVAAGNAYVNGKMKYFEAAQTFTVEAANANLARIDNVIMRRDDVNRDFTIFIQKGVFSSEPAAPSITRENGVYDLVLAQIYVEAAAISISQENITDTRPDTSLCGYVASTITQMDFSQFTAQWASYIANFKKENEDSYTTWENNRKEIIQAFEDAAEASFNEWYAGIKGQLEEDANTRLTEVTNEHEDRLLLLEHMLIKNDITCPVQLETSAAGNPVLLVDADGKAILANWHYEEA
ncbi:MAG: hypothetical protein PUE16_00365 [Lactimicrobium massiliense]|nr:hypothetical protein [Lactimicrobium massiliense]MDD6725785.1 hypothetical protein [Lactimicrobium massiliense]